MCFVQLECAAAVDAKYLLEKEPTTQLNSAHNIGTLYGPYKAECLTILQNIRVPASVQLTSMITGDLYATEIRKELLNSQLEIVKLCPEKISDSKSSPTISSSGFT